MSRLHKPPENRQATSAPHQHQAGSLPNRKRVCTCCHAAVVAVICYLLYHCLHPAQQGQSKHSSQAPQPAAFHQHKTCRHGCHLYRDGISQLHHCSFHPSIQQKSISQLVNQPINQSMNQISIVLLRGAELQVAGQYLEFLVSQDRFEEAAALMPRLLKVPDAACLPFAAHCYQLWVLPPASRPSCSAIL